MNSVRRRLLQALALLPIAASTQAAPVRKRLPVLFLGHGTPMTALANNDYTKMLMGLGMRIPKPRAVLAVSALWQTDWVTGVQAGERPETLHDFVGYPSELDRLDYPAPGAPDIAEQAASLIGDPARLFRNQGFDSGVWSVLRHLYPNANIPVFQVSVDMMQPGAMHWSIGRSLAPLREEGVLIVCTGNIVHNLQMTDDVPDSPNATRVWAQSFDMQVARLLGQRRDDRLALVSNLPYARDAAPTVEHYWPLLYALGASCNEGAPKTLYSGFQNGTISMRSLLFGTLT
ncbi:dioxygenase family protein [Paraburkholderia sp. A3RO-2L]|jgi:4,5-DOPA dioxygenase extradiol|uniref:dioxygenase family protein n=1 Tax=Paraburkholderia sp. A3RO-2L TaxID=3028376 RepID=UPI003DA8F3EA